MLKTLIKCKLSERINEIKCLFSYIFDVNKYRFFIYANMFVVNKYLSFILIYLWNILVLEVLLIFVYTCN